MACLSFPDDSENTGNSHFYVVLILRLLETIVFQSFKKILKCRLGMNNFVAN